MSNFIKPTPDDRYYFFGSKYLAKKFSHAWIARLIAVCVICAAFPYVVFAQSHIDIVAQTPCLIEYRSWFFTFRRSEKFQSPPNYSKDQCEQAANVNERIQIEQVESRLIMNAFLAQVDEDEGRTECLREYRVWLEKFSGTQTFDEGIEKFVPFKLYGQQICTSAKQVHERIATQKQAKTIAEDAERKRAASIDLQAGVKRRARELQARAQRDAMAGRPGVRIGMTSEDVVERSNWGPPQVKNRTTTAIGSAEQWVYGGRSYLYFENNRLVSIQNSDVK